MPVKASKLINPFSAGIAFLGVLFMLNICSGARKTNAKLTYPTAKQIIATAVSFLPDSRMANMGKRLDCSGYTRAVYSEWGIELAPSSLQQYRECVLVENDELSMAYLVFFRTGGDEVSHVGILLSDSTFIHSPGRGRNVRIDSLDHKYWKQRFIGAGKAGFSGDFGFE